MKKAEQFRQGDVFIERVAKLPKAKKQKEGRVILAHGEVTGHAHEIDTEAADAWKQGEDTVAVRVKKASRVTHQEHAPISLKKGNYKITRQREYAPEEIRRVAD